MLRSAAAGVVLLLAAWRPAAAAPPNGSLATLPVGYYGSSWPTKHAEQIEFLAKMRFVVLMQQDGECWKKCCPHNDGGSACQPRSLPGANRIPVYNASSFPGCDPGCDQHGTQDAVFTRIREAAAAAGLAAPHMMIYMNAVYDWPYDAAHAGGNAVDVLDIHGVPHAEQCDPGIYPSFFLDYGREAGRAAFLNAVDKYIVKGSADGVYLDCFDQMPLSCNADNTSCVAIRNQKGNNASIVTHSQVTEYVNGKRQSLSRATAMVAEGKGGMFTAKTWATNNSHDPYGANTALIGRGGFEGTPQDLIATVQSTLFTNGYKHGIVMHGLSAEARPYTPWPPPSMCTEYQLASFLLALPTPSVEHSLFLECSGWDPRFALPLGNPLGPAAVGADGIMRRAFESGVTALWDTSCGNRTTAECANTTWPDIATEPLRLLKNDDNPTADRASTVLLATDDTSITLSMEGTSVFITSLRNPTRGWEWVSGNKTPLPLVTPDGGAKWSFEGVEVDRSNGVKATLRFKSSAPELELESVWWARPGPGPVENWQSVRNTGGGSVQWGSAPPPPGRSQPCVSILNNTVTRRDAFSICRTVRLANP